jgi:hypothetical protein
VKPDNVVITLQTDRLKVLVERIKYHSYSDDESKRPDSESCFNSVNLLFDLFRFIGYFARRQPADAVNPAVDIIHLRQKIKEIPA